MARAQRLILDFHPFLSHGLFLVLGFCLYHLVPSEPPAAMRLKNGQTLMGLSPKRIYLDWEAGEETKDGYLLFVEEKGARSRIASETAPCLVFKEKTHALAGESSAVLILEPKQLRKLIRLDHKEGQFLMTRERPMFAPCGQPGKVTYGNG